MKNFVVIALFSILLASCGDDVTRYELNPPADLDLPAAEDTIPTIDLGAEPDSFVAEDRGQVLISVDEDGVNISAPNFSTDRNDDVSHIVVDIDEQGNVEYVQVNKIILYQEKQQYKINHAYRYIEDDVIEIQSGNVLDAIIADHRAQGYKITRESVKNCNPFLHKRNLQVGDCIRLSCDSPGKTQKRKP